MKSSKSLKRDLEEMLVKSRNNTVSIQTKLDKILSDSEISKAKKITAEKITENKNRKEQKSSQVALQIQSYKPKPDKKRP